MNFVDTFPMATQEGSCNPKMRSNFPTKKGDGELYLSVIPFKSATGYPLSDNNAPPYLYGVVIMQ